MNRMPREVTIWRPDRIEVRRNPKTGSWRATIGGRLAYYARTWGEAMERADQLAHGRAIAT